MSDYIDEKTYAAYLKDKTQLLKSASGGMFTALSDVYLEEGNAIVCCVYNPDADEPELKLIFTTEERNSARGSKYIQSNPKNVYTESVQFLKEYSDKKILFFGTGCQAAAYLNYMRLEKMENRIMTVDIICHGVPSPKLWREYVYMLKNQMGEGQITYLSFRDKRTGWNSSSSIAKLGKVEVNVQDYKKYLYGPMTLRPSCYVCPFAKLSRETDLTIGDFWGIDKNYPEMMNNDGVSIAIVHTNSGTELFEQAKRNMVWKETDVSKSLQDNLIRPTAYSPQRERFMKYYKRNGFEKTFKLYADNSFWGKLKRKLIKLVR